MSDGAGDEDLVELGRVDRGGQGLGQRLLGDRFHLPDGWRPSPGWRPSRGACVLAAAALVVGLAGGYAAGRGSGILPAPVAVQPEPVRPSAAASPLRSPAWSFAYESPALTQDTGACAVQSGRHLALGVQVTNQSTVPLTLRSATAVLPLGGLTQGTWHWMACGAIPQSLAAQVEILQPGASTWLTMTFNVLAACPAPYPVQFTIGYLAQGRAGTARLPGFPDLSQVPYTGCPRG
ncbi:MAG TPA: hypothetical protein VF838_00770 [Trebonia sp.]